MNVFRQSDFTGGENRKLLPEFVAPNQLTLAQNCLITAEGLTETRAGKVKVNTTSLGEGNVLSVARFAKENGTKYIVAQHGTSLYAKAWDGTQFAEFGTAVKTGLTAGEKLRYVVWKDNLIAYSQNVSPFRFDGTTCTDLTGTPPKFVHLVLYAGRLWGIDAANPNFIRFSGLENYNAWDALDLINVRSGDGDKLTALVPVSGGMLVCKTRNIYPLFGTSRFDLVLGEAVSGVGCVSTDGAPAGIVMAADNWYLAGLSGVEAVPETHTPLLDALTFAQKQSVFSVYQSRTRRAFYHLPTGETVVLDGKRNAITTFRGLGASCFDVAEAIGDDGALLMGGEGHVYTLNGTTDDGSAIETYIKTPYQDYGSGWDKEWRVFWPKIDMMDAGNYQIFLKYDVDFAAVKGQSTFTGLIPDYLDWGVDAWGTAYWGTGANGLEIPYWMHDVRGEYVSFEIRTSQRIKFKGYESRYRVAGRKS